MWINGYLDGDTAYEAKVFNRPSFWGIRNSRISKLIIYKWRDDEWVETFHYNRNSEPFGSIDEDDLNKLLTKYPGQWSE